MILSLLPLLTSLLSLSLLSGSTTAAPAPLNLAEAEDISPLVARAPPGTPSYTGVRISSVRSGQCISANFVRPPGEGQGSTVYSVDCSQARTWDIYPGGSIVLRDYPELALDAGLNPGNNGQLKVWKSYPGSNQQTWQVTNVDRRNIKIGLKSSDQCLDQGPNGIQTYKCYNNNPNQVFRTEVPN